MQAALKWLSKLPQTKPIKIGMMTATRDMNGMLASPVAPRATRVKNGPSFKDRMEMAPVSVAFPNWEDSEMYKEPLELVMAAIQTKGAMPRKPAGPQSLPTTRPTITPRTNLTPVMATPLYKGIPTCLMSIMDPQTIKKKPIMQALPS